MSMEQQSSYNKYILLSIALILFVAIFLFARFSPVVGPSPQTQNMPKSASVFSLKIDKNEVSAGGVAVVQVQADSNGEDVSGFDLLFKSDPEMYSFAKAQAPDGSYDIMQQDQNGHISITGIKKLSVSTTKKFSGTTLVEIPVTMKKAGTVNIVLLPKNGKQKTKVVDAQSRVIAQETEATVVVTVK